MNVLLTGASGFLGTYIYDHLVSRQEQVITIGRHSNNDIVCDLSAEVPMIHHEKVDMVIHAAGKAHSVPKTEGEKQSFYAVNLDGTAHLLQSLQALTSLPKQFIFISSVAVYGQERGININEDALLLAKDPYGLSKIQAEAMVANWCSKNNIICTILRLPLIVGVNPPGNLGAMIKAIQKGYYFNIGGGKAKKSMVLAEDVARFIPTIAAIGGIYNLTDGDHPTFMALSNGIAKRKILNLPLFAAKLIAVIGDGLGDNAPINSVKLKKIVSDLIFNDSKARALGWQSQSVLGYLQSNVV